ncbi:O-antigen ligase family protein, partial [Neobacillus drentensis]|uniref:O-antigen ligase family protein n=1 Tax=Neobacillus drentensis TaxID=220684 RepID=UPI002FFF4EBC
FNILKLSFVENYIIPDFEYISEESRIWGTLSNPNYISGISSTLFCLFFILSVLEKKIKLRITNIILLTLSFVILLSSVSSSGFVTITILIPIFLVFLMVKKQFKQVLISVILIFALSIAYIPMVNHNERVWDETIGQFVKSNPFHKDLAQKIEKPLAENKPVIVQENNNQYNIPEIPAFGVSWGSGRGYIWKQAISLILEKPILGYGLDTFAFHFPQNDVNIVKAFGGFTIIDKPHSMYLGIAFGAGVFGLISYLLMIASPIIKSLIYFYKGKEFNPFILAIVFALFAYLLQSIVNDSVIGYSVIFFVFLGVLNSMFLEESN